MDFGGRPAELQLKPSSKKKKRKHRLVCDLEDSYKWLNCGLQPLTCFSASCWWTGPSYFISSHLQESVCSRFLWACQQAQEPPPILSLPHFFLQPTLPTKLLLSASPHTRLINGLVELPGRGQRVIFITAGILCNKGILCNGRAPGQLSCRSWAKTTDLYTLKIFQLFFKYLKLLFLFGNKCLMFLFQPSNRDWCAVM